MRGREGAAVTSGGEAEAGAVQPQLRNRATSSGDSKGQAVPWAPQEEPRVLLTP